MERKTGTGGECMRFDGISPADLSPKLFVAREVISPIPPRSVRMVGTSRQSYLAGVDISPREVRLHLNVAGRSHANANELAQRVAAWLCRTELAEYEPTHMPGKALSVILQSASDPEWHWGFGVIEYAFVAPRPYLHSVSETVAVGDAHVYIEPRGTVPCAPTIEHRLAADTEVLTISVSSGGSAASQVMAIRDPYGNPLPAGIHVSVDFARRLLQINGAAALQYIDYTASDWHPEITGGTLITISDAGDTTVRWRDEWM